MEEPEDYSPVGQERDTEPASEDERVQHFIRMLADDDEMSRWKAAETLGRLGDRAAVGPLIDTLGTRTPGSGSKLPGLLAGSAILVHAARSSASTGWSARM